MSESQVYAMYHVRVRVPSEVRSSNPQNQTSDVNPLTGI